ncbi:MAG: type II secretion system F family protein [Rhodopila sp.]|nr:type II secretion system F family protein [Rhodopila sp.]
MPAFSPLMLLAAWLLILVGFGFSGLLVSRAQAQEKRLQHRRDNVLRPHMRAQTIDIRLFTRAPRSETTLQARVASWFGIDLERPDVCPLPWWVMVGGAAVGAEVGASAATALVGPIAWLGLPVAWIFASRTAFGYFSSKRREKLLVQFPDALMMIVRSIRVGVPVTEAIHIIAHEQPQPTSGEFALMANQLSIGEPLDTAILAMARHAGVPEYRFFATALTLQSKAGGALSGTLEGLADLIRKRLAVKERAHALASEAKMSIYVLTALPFLVGGALGILNPAYIGVLFTDPLGNKVLIGAATALCCGLGTMRFIMKKSMS